MTTGERLIQISGMSGVSAAMMMQAIGIGSTTGEALVNYSGLPSATAAEHLMADVALGRFGGGPGFILKRKKAKKVFVELDDDILLFDRPDDAYHYLRTRDRVSTVSSTKTGRPLVSKGKASSVIEPDVINVKEIQAYVENLRLQINVIELIKRLEFERLLALKEQMEEEDVIILLGAFH